MPITKTPKDESALAGIILLYTTIENIDVPRANKLVSKAARADWNKNRRFFQIGEKNQWDSIPGITA